VKPRILILGGDGMLGHKLLQIFSGRFDETFATIRGTRDDSFHSKISLFADRERILEGLDVTHFDALEAAVQRLRPGVVINAVGMVKQRSASRDAVASVQLNALLPHQLSAICAGIGSRLIHISTDCVFDGQRGDYREDDPPNASDLYGRSKALGEVIAPHVLTLRTSIVGRELRNDLGLVEWFLAQQGSTVRGFRRAHFSGLTTNRLSRILAELLAGDVELSGLYHLAGESISKFHFLVLVRRALGVDVEVVPDDDLVIDRTLNSSRFTQATGRLPPTWDDMLSELTDDPTPYERWKQ
jgi:dTDP-4-dehydrorhamnose reductase